jgi:hypothetical protein
MVHAQRGPWGRGGTPHAMVVFCAAKGGPAAVLYARGVGGKHGEAEVVAETCLDHSSRQLKCWREREGEPPGSGSTARTAEEAGAHREAKSRTS